MCRKKHFRKGNQYMSINEEVMRHYDLLIEEGNDPTKDPRPLMEYMDKWDGDVFIRELCLTKEKSVLEVGVGTGRLALRVAPFCGRFIGIDISPKTIDRASENFSLYGIRNAELISADFITYNFHEKFDVIYSSLTFMHFENKEFVVEKIFDMLNKNGRFVLSIDKNRSDIIDTGVRKIKIFPDFPEHISRILKSSGFVSQKIIETEFAYIFSAI